MLHTLSLFMKVLTSAPPGPSHLVLVGRNILHIYTCTFIPGLSSLVLTDISYLFFLTFDLTFTDIIVYAQGGEPGDKARNCSTVNPERIASVIFNDFINPATLTSLYDNDFHVFYMRMRMT